MSAFLLFCFIGLTLTEESLNLNRSPNPLFHSDEGNHSMLSVLILHSLNPGHFFPLVALGAELVSRGHQVTVLGPTVERYEHLPKLAKSHGMKVISADFIPYWLYEQVVETGKHEGSGDLTTIVYNITQTLFNASEDNEIYFLKMKKEIDKLNSSNYDYIISDIATAYVGYYIQSAWNNDNIMLVMPTVPIQPQYSIPWPFPCVFSPISDNMSFYDRFLTTVLYNPMEKVMFVVFDYLLRIDKERSIFDASSRFFEQPLLINTVIGFDWPKTILPLQHYVGPMFLSTSPPLDSTLVDWLSNIPPDSQVIYVSMGTTGEVTDKMAKAFIELSLNYIIVWSLRQSNHDILNGLSINKDRVYISPWISQITMLQHHSVVLAILHCGINGVMEALYHSVPVICFPSVYEQFDVAYRLESQGLGIWFIPSKVTTYDIVDSVHKIRTSGYNEQVRKVSCLLRAGGGAKKGADLVELYADIGHDHGIPSFIRYKWNFIQYYNIDVWLVIVSSVIIIIWGSHKMCKCCLSYCSSHQKTKRD